MSVTVQVPRKPETCVGLDDKKEKGNESVLYIGKLLQIWPKILEIKQLSRLAQNMTNGKEDFVSFKTEQTHFVSSLNKTVVSLKCHHIPLRCYHK
jgi:hypothetical protein